MTLTTTVSHKTYYFHSLHCPGIRRWSRRLATHFGIIVSIQ